MGDGQASDTPYTPESDDRIMFPDDGAF